MNRGDNCIFECSIGVCPELHDSRRYTDGILVGCKNQRN